MYSLAKFKGNVSLYCVLRVWAFNWLQTSQRKGHCNLHLQASWSKHHKESWAFFFKISEKTPLSDIWEWDLSEDERVEWLIWLPMLRRLVFMEGVSLAGSNTGNWVLLFWREKENHPHISTMTHLWDKCSISSLAILTFNREVGGDMLVSKFILILLGWEKLKPTFTTQSYLFPTMQ